MAADALRLQVASKWQESFQRFNREYPGIAGLMSFSEAWAEAEAYLYPRDLSGDSHLAKKDFHLPHVQQAFTIMSACKMLPILLENFINMMRKQAHLITRDVEYFMKRYDEGYPPRELTMSELIQRLVEWHRAWSPTTELGFTVCNAFNLEFQTHIFSILPPSFASGFKLLLRNTLVTPRERGVWADFELLGLVDRYENLIASVCYEQIEARVQETCVRDWSELKLAGLRMWMAEKVVPWMILPYARGAKTTDEARTMLQGVGSRFDFHICKTLCDLRTSEIFDIIVDYPDSSSALQDLKECLQRVDQRSNLVQRLRKLNKKRLLHPGADTKDILQQYVSTIRCLRIIDPPGVLLFKVADPIRRYLRDRPDTIRCIVASLVGEGGDLVDENEPVQPLQTHIEDYSDPNWEPEPIDAGPDFRTNKPSDVISTLVSIYDSKDLFVKELQVLLAQRLLAISDGNFEKERRNIEILKLRFGEAALQVCEVMLKDMTDSRRIDQHVQSQKASILHPTIISKHFWPSLQSSSIVMPGQFKDIQRVYSEQFTTFKPDKKLRWLTHLGTVHLEVQLNDRTLDLEVPPLEAAIIELFSEKETWTVNELVAQIGTVDATSVHKALATWVDHGAIKVDGEQFHLLEIAEAAARHGRAAKPASVEEEETVVIVQQQHAEQMRVYWKFIEGMLTNLGSLGLDRIQTMLKFAPGYDRTTEQLAVFMEAARREGLVTSKDGMWKLNR